MTIASTRFTLSDSRESDSPDGREGRDCRRLSVRPGFLKYYSKLDGGTFVSIIRVGLAETKNFADGYEAIFGNKKKGDQAKTTESSAKSDKGKKKKAKKKK